VTSIGRQLLLGVVGEEEFTRHVKRWADRAGWCGRHVRYSQGVVEGVHTRRLHGHSDAHGALDWEFKHRDPGHALIVAELKTVHGRLSPEQRAEVPRLNGCRCVEAYAWRPDMEDEIKRIFAEH
jgi:hypothetical protein